MQIVIPMSGFGERFRRAGYAVPKPLIEVDGKPIIAHVIDMFPGETDFLFICNEEHLSVPAFRMREILQQHAPTGTIVGIPPHKLGPVHAVQQVQERIDDSRPVIVNYCDFTCYWDWHDFCDFVRTSGCHGAIPAYRGFHPHSLGTTNYAYVREENGWALDIQEKQPFTTNRMQEYASSGTYFFSSGALMKHAFSEMKAHELITGGEYYVSLAYKPLLKEKQPIAVYELQHFMQWGTPQDLAEYVGWSDAFRRMMLPATNSSPSGAIVMPMAGLGERFSREGYEQTKPLIEVSGRPMIENAMSRLPPASYHSFVLRKDMQGVSEISQQLLGIYPDAAFTFLDHVTDGQARTAKIGFDALTEKYPDLTGPVTIGACDYAALYDEKTLRNMMADDNIDVIVWVARGYPNAARKPEMFGWIEESGGQVKGVSVKKPLGNPETDPIVLGTFTFKNKQTFGRIINQFFERGKKVNGEFYLDSCLTDALDLGLNCQIFEVVHYLCWGTPDDLRTFEYWQSCFHKWAGHPYTLDADVNIPKSKIDSLSRRFRKKLPSAPRKADAPA